MRCAHLTLWVFGPARPVPPVPEVPPLSESLAMNVEDGCRDKGRIDGGGDLPEDPEAADCAVAIVEVATGAAAWPDAEVAEELGGTGHAKAMILMHPRLLISSCWASSVLILSS